MGVSAPSVLILTAVAILNVPTAPVGGFAIAVVYDRDVTDAAWRRAVACAGTPAVGMDAADNDRRTVTDRVEAVQVGIVVAAAAVIVIAVEVGIVAPLGIAGADEDRARVPAAMVTGAVTCSIGRAHRSEVRIIVTGGECRGRGHDNGDSAKTHVFDHDDETT